MKDAELIEVVCQKSGVTEDVAQRVLSAFLGTVIDGLTRGETVSIADFGRFYIRTMAEVERYHPAIKEKVTIPQHKFPAFKPARFLKEVVRKS